jgi:hypothetical protein
VSTPISNFFEVFATVPLDAFRTLRQQPEKPLPAAPEGASRKPTGLDFLESKRFAGKFFFT